ncbi:MAG: YciI family protein [Thermoanaerobaculia bacterium]|nr:YciI family protein [Thermoanaerobaculia bacterium]
MRVSSPYLVPLLLVLLLSVPFGVFGEEEREGSAPMELDTYQLVLLKRPAEAPDYPEERLQEIQRAHLGHLTRMAEEGHLVVAGPFRDQPDESLRGMALYRVESLEEARRLAEADPAVKAGRLEVEVMIWHTRKGALEFPVFEEMRRAQGDEAPDS